MLKVAKECIGKVLVHRTPHGEMAARIVETEAYRGPDDRAAHSHGGRRTTRTEVMFGPAGYAYTFIVYGMHWHFNLVTGRAGEPHAVLIRAVEPLAGVDLMAEHRRMAPNRRELTNGPGKLCAALSIDRRHYGADLCGPELFLAEGAGGGVARSPRIGIAYAGAWAQKPWRFFERSNPYVSRAPRTKLSA